MSKYIIKGPTALRGDITPSGAKNAALKLIAASVLTDNDIVLNNVPRIADVFTMLEIIKKLGGTFFWLKKHKLKINCSGVNGYEIDAGLSSKLRASVVLVGPLLARFGKAILPSTGGDAIGKRSIDTHLNGFKKFGVKIKFLNNKYFFTVENLQPADFFMDEMSVTATENFLILGAGINGKTIIRGVAAEPEIENLASMVEQMGANVKGVGTHRLEIKGGNNLSGAEIDVIPDRIEIGTLACATIASQGEVIIKNVIKEHIENLLAKFDQIGAKYKFEIRASKFKGNLNIINITYGDLKIMPSHNLKPIYIDTRPYPGFSTDLQAPVALLLTQAKGESRIFETLFEGRLGYSKELRKMGADLSQIDAHNLIIKGPCQLKGATISTADIRAGATLVLAGLIAHGTTQVNHTEIIERGYEDYAKKLNSLGAKIKQK